VGKNLIGAFYQPDAVFIDPTVLSTLPRREFRAGLYEVIKYGMTSSAPLFDRLGQDRKAIAARQPEVLAAVIAESCRIKAAVVADRGRDEARQKDGRGTAARRAADGGRRDDDRGRRDGKGNARGAEASRVQEGVMP